MSLPYGIAVALETGGAMLDQYTPEALRRPPVLALARPVTVVHDPAVPDGAEPFVDADLGNGRRLSARVMVARGDCTNPLSEDEFVARFRTTAGSAFGAARLARIEKAVRDIARSSNVRALGELLRPAAAKARRSHAGVA